MHGGLMYTYIIMKGHDQSFTKPSCVVVTCKLAMGKAPKKLLVVTDILSVPVVIKGWSPEPGRNLCIYVYAVPE